MMMTPAQNCYSKAQRIKSPGTQSVSFRLLARLYFPQPMSSVYYVGHMFRKFKNSKQKYWTGNNPLKVDGTHLLWLNSHSHSLPYGFLIIFTAFVFIFAVHSVLKFKAYLLTAQKVNYFLKCAHTKKYGVTQIAFPPIWNRNATHQDQRVRILGWLEFSHFLVWKLNTSRNVNAFLLSNQVWVQIIQLQNNIRWDSEYQVLDIMHSISNTTRCQIPLFIRFWKNAISNIKCIEAAIWYTFP